MRLGFALLGPLEVRVGGRELTLEGPVQRRILAALLLRAGHSVTVQRLAEAAWDDNQPSTARHEVQNRVSGLRRRLVRAGVADPIDTTHAGYRLRIDSDHLDVSVFDRLVSQASACAAGNDVAGAIRVVREALALWRGPALAGLGGDLLSREAAALGERRLAAWEQCVQWELASGAHDRVVSELGLLVAEHPLRERLVGQYMLALYRADRQADALTAYQDVARRLADDLGIDPGPDLRRLYGDILRKDPGLRPPGVDQPNAHEAGKAARYRSFRPPLIVPAQLPPDVAGFVGRDEHLRLLDKLLGSPDSSTATVISTIAGTAGVGKTTLAVHWAHRVRGEFPDGQLYVNLRGFDSGGQAMTPAEAVRGFLDALEISAQRIPAGLDAQAGLYRSLLAERRVLIVLDNARDTEQARPLLPGSPGCRVVITSRNRLAGLVAVDGAHPLTLDLLSTEEARQVLAARLGADRVTAEAQAVEDIIASCARLPLALAIVAGRAATHPGLGLAALAAELRQARGGLAALAGGDDPHSDLRAVFSWSYHTLTPPAARLFRLLGIHPGPEVSTPATGSLIGLPVEQTRALLAELTSANLVTEQAPGRYTLHDLLRAYATEQVHTHDSDDVRRAATHRLLDHYLHTAHTADRLLAPHRRPITLTPPQPEVTPEQPADHDDALAWFASEHPVLLAAVDHAAAAGFDTHTCQLARTVVEFLDRRGHWHDWAAIERAAVAAARRLADPPAQACAHRSLALAYTRLGRHDEADTQLRHALDLYRQTGDQEDQALTHNSVAAVWARQGRHAEALHHAQQALDLYAAVGHQRGLARALNSIGWCHAQLGDHQQALAYCERALILLQELGDRSGEAATWDSLGYAHHHLGHHHQAATCYRHALNMRRDLGDRYEEADTLTHLGDTHRAAGDPDAARDAWHDALTILDELDHPDGEHLRAKLHHLDQPATPTHTS